MTDTGFSLFGPPQPTEPEFRPQKHKQCKFCDQPIFIEDRAVYLHHGELGVGRKSGQPVVVDGQHTSGDAVLHEACSVAYLLKNITDSADDIETLIDAITLEHFGKSFSEVVAEQNKCVVCDVEFEDDDE